MEAKGYISIVDDFNDSRNPTQFVELEDHGIQEFEVLYNFLQKFLDKESPLLAKSRTLIDFDVKELYPK